MAQPRRPLLRTLALLSVHDSSSEPPEALDAAEPQGSARAHRAGLAGDLQIQREGILMYLRLLKSGR
jgi:hypothetical protein